MELYRIIGKHLPETDENDSGIDFIGKIVENARQSSTPQDYIDAIILLSGESLLSISKMSSDQRLEIFISGLVDNKILQLKAFCNTMGFNHG